MSRSEDGGFTWTKITNDFGSGENILDVAFGNGWFIVVGTNGRMRRSNDGGKTWQGISSPAFPGTWIQGIAYGNNGNNGTFIAVGRGGRMGRSTNDGESWTAIRSGLSDNENLSAITSQFADNDDIYAIASNGDGTFVAAGDRGRMARSVDGGQNWFQITPGLLTANPSAIGRKSSFDDTTRITGIAYGDGTFIAVGHKGRMARNSRNGATGDWDQIRAGNLTDSSTSGTQEWFEGIAYGELNGQKRFVAVGAQGQMARSRDKGLTWERINPSANAGEQAKGEGSGFLARQTIYGIAFGDGKFLAVGQNSRMSLNLLK